MKPLASLFAAVASSAIFAVPVKAQDASTVLATVAGEDITLGHLIVAADALPPQFQALPDEQLFSGLLEQTVRQLALAASIGGDLSPRQRLSLQAQRWAFLANDLVNTAIDEALTEEAVAAAYAAEFGEGTGTLELNAAHILVETEEEARAVVTELEGGAGFADLAQARSIGPSGPKGGALGWFVPAQMVPAFAQAAQALQPGQISAPVETQFGWHVILLNDTRKSKPSLEEVRSRLEERLSNQAAQEIMGTIVGAAEIVRTDVEIDPALIRNTNLIVD